MVNVHVHVGDSLDPVLQHPGDRDRRIVVDAKPRRALGHRVMEAARRIEGVFGAAGHDGFGDNKGGTGHASGCLVHTGKDRVVARAESELPPVAGLPRPGPLHGVDVSIGVDQSQLIVRRDPRSDLPHLVVVHDPVREDQLSREHYPVRAEGMLGAVIVCNEIGRVDHCDIGAHGRITASASISTT
jgi:hypothetical protein